MFKWFYVIRILNNNDEKTCDYSYGTITYAPTHIKDGESDILRNITVLLSERKFECLNILWYVAFGI